MFNYILLMYNICMNYYELFMCVTHSSEKFNTNVLSLFLCLSLCFGNIQG